MHFFSYFIVNRNTLFTLCLYLCNRVKLRDGMYSTQLGKVIQIFGKKVIRKLVLDAKKRHHNDYIAQTGYPAYNK